MEKLISRFYSTFIYEERWRFFLDGFLTTLLLTFASFLCGTIFGAILCGLRFVKSKFVNKLTKGITNFFIQLPTLVLLMVFVYIVFRQTSLSVLLIVIIGLTIKSGAYISEIFYTAIKSINEGQAEAARAMGMTAYQAFKYITFPQALESALPLYKNQFIITLQETSIVGSLAIQDITKATSIVTARTLDAFFGLIFTTVVYLTIGYISTLLLRNAI